MIRRDPTRIEFTMDDVEVYKMRRENKAASGVKNNSNGTTLDATKGAEGAGQGAATADTKSKSDAIRERIGFDPTPRTS